jgi:glycosyltransferase involved in cell wall biosynthesis
MKPLEPQVLPRVSLLISMKNESRFITETLAAVFAQDYPEDKLEVIIADGRSEDDSREIVRGLIADKAHYHLIDNPDMIQSCGWNLGISRCTGEIIGIVSAHCRLERDYVSRAVETIERTGADLVGGPMTAISSGSVGRAIALATMSPFGVGGARFHYISNEEEVDTVYQGLCHRELYSRLGGFDTEMVRNQDDELSFRIRKAGGRIVCNPDIRSSYHNRSTLRSLARQYFQYGFWKVRLMQKCMAQMQLRHFVPAVFASVVLLLPVLAVFWPFLLLVWLGVVGLYVGGAVLATAFLARRERSSALALVPMIFPILHFSYGLGFVKGIVVWPFRGAPGTAPRLEMVDIGARRAGSA